MKNAFIRVRRTLLSGVTAAFSVWPILDVDGQNQNGITTSPSDNYVCVQRGPNSRIWQRSVISTKAAGIITTNLHSYTELATGVCYLQNGQYVDSVEEIDPTPTGAQATQGRHQVQWAANANTPGGAVRLTTADNKTLQSTVFGLLYFDSSSGSNVLLARLQDCTATINANTLTYSNAFSNLTADIVYVYKKAGLSQDIVLQQQPPSPAAYGLDPATTCLEVLTEFFNPPDPAVTTMTNSGATDDVILDFGDMKMRHGQASLLDNDTKPADGISVTKAWTNIDNETFLIESVPYTSISNSLSTLHSSVISPKRVRRTVSIDPSLPRSGKAAVPRTAPVKIAKSPPAKTGFVIDYELLSSTNSLTLQGDTTYFVDGTVVVTGPLTIEGGTVVKYANANVSIQPYTVICETSEYRPGVFTSMDDNSVGETIDGSTGEPMPYGGAYCLEVYDSPPLVFQYLRFSYAQQGIIMNGYFSTNTVGLWDCQFIGCQYGMSTSGTFSSGYLFQLYNVLFSGVRCGVAGPGSGYFNLSAINVTADNGWHVVSSVGTNICYATNCLFSGISVAGMSLSDCATNASAEAFYETVGAAGYYLPANSTNRAVGTTNIDANLLADLQIKTTQPPLVMSGQLTNNYTFTNQAARDNTGMALDLGYHYDPLDYAISLVVSNAALTVQPGTALAVIGSGGFGFLLQTNATIDCVGTPLNPNFLLPYNAVQEQVNTNWESSSTAFALLAVHPVSASASLFRFTEWCSTAIYLADSSIFPTVFEDCQFYNSTLTAGAQSLTSGNCLFQRATVGLNDQYYFAGASNTFYNNLFESGRLSVAHWPGNPGGVWIFRDNLFNQTSITNPLSSSVDISISNGYVTTNYGTLVPTSGVILGTAPAFESGALGQYYYPASQTNLIYQGSRLAAAAGLYHYTVTTNNVIEGTNTVSIGFHYVATDANGVPLDTTGDGLPDYVKDGNGDGVYDSGDFANWLSPFNVYDVGISILGYTVTTGRLAYWSFNNTYEGLEGQQPTVSNAVFVPNWSGYGVALTNSAGTDRLGYNVVEPSDGRTNFNAANGTIRFWFKPNWSIGEADAPSGGCNFFDAADPSGGWNLYFTDATNYGAAIMQFSYSSNSYGEPWTFKDGSLNGAPIHFQSNLWYQIVLTYTPTNFALYTNGALVATGNLPPQIGTTNLFVDGNGLAFPPAEDLLTQFGFGNAANVGSSSSVLGQLDELETFNYALTAQAVAAGFPDFANNATNMVDTYYVGRSDMVQSYVDGVFPPVSGSAAPCRLGYWRFDSDLLISEQGQIPISDNEISLVPSWSGTALNINSNPGSQVTYWDVYSNGWANVNCRQGTLRFWFKPNWTGSPPNAPFVYLGNPNPATSQWALGVNSVSEITLVTASNGITDTVLTSGTVPFNSSHWMQIVLTYGPTGTTLYTNGVWAASGSAVTNWPDLADRNLGMVIGNNTAYNSSINGQFDELETFNYQLSSSEILTNFQLVQNIDSDLDGIPDLLEDIKLPNSRPFLGTPTVITGTLEAEQFDMGSNGVGYSTANTVPQSLYRPTLMIITNCDDLGGGYCLDQTHAGEWTQYTIDVLVAQNYTVETRVEGANGVFECEFMDGSFYTNTGPLTVNSTNWTNVSGVVALPRGVYTMRLHFLTNGSYGEVGRFNYISIYPWWQAGFSTANSTNVSGLMSNVDSWKAATNNAILIQNAVNSMESAGGGTVYIPSGTYYLSQSHPVEINPVYENAAVTILAPNIEIAGAGENNTILIGYNRATALFSVGQSAGGQFAITNVTLQDMTLEAQPHLAVANLTNTSFELGQLVNGTGTGTYTGFLTYFVGAATNATTDNIVISNCQFLYSDYSIGLSYNVSDCLITHCDFTIWGGTNFYTRATNNYPTNTPNTASYSGSVGIFSPATADYNVIVVDNTYIGNTNLVPSTANPFGYVSTNDSELLGPDGFINFQGGGNYFIARNVISNNNLEGVQFSAGPSSVVGNAFGTLINSGSTCALCLTRSGDFGALGANAINSSTCFIGNSVFGGRQGQSSAGESASSLEQYYLNFSGNDVFLYPPTVDSYPGGMISPISFQWINALGNTLENGGLGAVIVDACGSAIIMNNNFANANYRGIGLDPTVGTGSVQNAAIFNNILGGGSTFHVQLPFTNSFGFFLRQNTYLNSSSNSVAFPFLDPIASAVHVN